MRAVSYLRVSTNEQAESGAGISAQLTAINSAVDARGWDLIREFRDEGVSGGVDWQDRFALSEAVALLEQGKADILVVSKLDRLTRSVGDFANIVARAKRKGWKLLILDVGLDLSTPTGELMANILASFATFERALISQRTKDGLAAKKASGIRLGRPSTLSEEHALQMREYRFGGYTYDWIAKWANTRGIPTGQGASQWTGSTVRAALKAWEGRRK